MKRKYTLGLLIIVVLSLAVSAFGAETVQKIEAYLVGDLNFMVDGEMWSPKDVDGSPMTPIIYKDRTYVPVRSLLEDKGVTVGYQAETRTVVLDYSTIKRIDKASPALMHIMDMADGKEITFKKNPNFDMDNMNASQEYEFLLDEDIMIYMDGKRVEGSLEDIMDGSKAWSPDSVMIKIDDISGEVKSVMINSDGMGDGGSDLVSKIGIEIEISAPPWKIKIRIKF